MYDIIERVAKPLTVPATQEALSHLRAGDKVLMTGTIYTARDAAHGRIAEAIQQGETIPFELDNAAIYYVGPTPSQENQVIGAAGPTTSGRMDSYTPALLRKGLKIMIGKGERNQAVKDAVVENGAVYLAALGGAGALMSQRITSCEVIAWDDLGCEAVRRLTVEEMPLTVVLDTHGGDLYQDGRNQYLNSYCL